MRVKLVREVKLCNIIVIEKLEMIMRGRDIYIMGLNDQKPRNF